jgi:hypothetical protein
MVRTPTAVHACGHSHPHSLSGQRCCGVQLPRHINLVFTPVACSAGCPKPKQRRCSPRGPDSSDPAARAPAAAAAAVCLGMQGLGICCITGHSTFGTNAASRRSGCSCQGMGIIPATAAAVPQHEHHCVLGPTAAAVLGTVAAVPQHEHHVVLGPAAAAVLRGQILLHPCCCLACSTCSLQSYSLTVSAPCSNLQQRHRG